MGLLHALFASLGSLRANPDGPALADLYPVSRNGKNAQGDVTMKSTSKLFAAAALFGVMSLALPVCTQAQDHSVEKGASEMYQGAKQDVKDTAITTKVKAALDTDKMTSHQVIHVDTVNGVVTLTGEVPSMTISQHAQEVAQSTSGVRAVRNELQVRSAGM